MLRIALRVRLRLRSAQDDTRGGSALSREPIKIAYSFKIPRAKTRPNEQSAHSGDFKLYFLIQFYPHCRAYA